MLGPVLAESMKATTMSLSIDPKSDFVRRHVGPGKGEAREMLSFLGYSEMEQLVQDTVPDAIRMDRELDLPPAAPEHVLLEEIRAISKDNKIFRSYLGLGYHDTVVPGVILRNILENPGWYTQYTPTRLRSHRAAWRPSCTSRPWSWI